ncbi:LexA family transcriptional regulator [Bacteroides cellulosilyticus]|uniref:LexA family transcriptional regulator n=1 Tax=Bacteroides cellulosilyticus TaxID=246787 RepID=UPI0022E0553A|nr:XRE family transcriptional regulator [Bacteroides cellulosilyticus]
MNRLNIAKLRKSLKMSQETFRKEVGISQSYLSELETGKKNLTEELYNSIIERFGRSIIIPFIEVDCDNIANNIPHLECNNKNVIPLFELEAASCGMPSGFEVAIEANKCDRYIIPDLAGCDFTIRTRGRSMINRSHPERSIPERSIVGCRIWKSRSHVRWGEVYALATPDGVVVKKIMPSEKDGYIKCVSFNEEEGFIPYDLPADEIQDWAIVVGVVTVMNWV